MKYSLTSLLTLFLQPPLTISTPASEHSPYCKTHPTLQFYDITYSDNTYYSTPAHMATAIGTIDFSISNTAVNYKSRCSALADAIAYPDFFYGNNTYPCTAPASAGTGASTNFTYSRPEGKFSINSIWSCGEGSEK